MSVPEFKEFIQESSLSEDAKIFWGKAFGCMNDEEASVAARFVDGNQRVLMFYTDTMQRKYEAFLKHDKSALEDILNQERAELAI